MSHTFGSVGHQGLGFYECGYFLGGGIADGHEGQAQDVLAHAHLLEYGFDTGGAAFGKQQVDAREELVVQLAGLVELIDEGEVHEVGHVFGKTVGCYRYNAFHAYGHLCYHQVVVAGEHGEVVWLGLEQLQALGYITAGFFDTNDGRAVGSEAQHGSRQQVAAGAARYVVEYNGLVGSSGDGFKVLVHAFLRWLVVVGGHAEDRVNTVKVGFFELAQYLLGVVAANAANYGHFAGAVVDDRSQHFSAAERVGVSAVVPIATRKSTPPFMTCSTSFSSAVKSTFPFLWKGVMRATPVPCSFCIAIY